MFALAMVSGEELPETVTSRAKERGHGDIIAEALSETGRVGKFLPSPLMGGSEAWMGVNAPQAQRPAEPSPPSNCD
jgi:hypothetical protein